MRHWFQAGLGVAWRGCKPCADLDEARRTFRGKPAQAADRLRIVVKQMQTIYDLTPDGGPIVDAHAVELADLLERCGERYSRARADEAMRAVEAPGFAFLRESKKSWSVTYEGKTKPLVHRAGMEALAVLLERAGKEVPALDLVQLEREDRRDLETPAPASEGRTRRGRGVHVDDVDDSTTRRDLERRIDDLTELSETVGLGEAGAEELKRLEAELVDLVAGLSKQGGRRFGSPDATAAKAATRSLRRCLKALVAEFPALGAHLQAKVTIRQSACCYEGERWVVRT